VRRRRRHSGKGDTDRRKFAPKAVPPLLVERMERALVLAAYVVVRHGPVYAPLLERLERELKIARRNDPTERAKRILRTHGNHTGLLPHAALNVRPGRKSSRRSMGHKRKPGTRRVGSRR
jgi:hypothetical protein